MVSVPSGSYSIGNRTYTGAEVGTITGTVDFASSAPYFGVGWGNATSGRLGIALDLGLVFQGTPQVSSQLTQGDTCIGDRVLKGPIPVALGVLGLDSLR